MARQQRQTQANEEQNRQFNEDITRIKTQYDSKAKERGAWQQKQQEYLNEKAALQDEMDRFVALHEGEINDLLAGYWDMRRQAGQCYDMSSADKLVCSGISMGADSL